MDDPENSFLFTLDIRPPADFDGHLEESSFDEIRQIKPGRGAIFDGFRGPFPEGQSGAPFLLISQALFDVVGLPMPDVVDV